ncbi:MAG: hypothetical protein WC579_01500 [Candidatus Paceibacterota bacterium]|jgi:hypothetical protein
MLKFLQQLFSDDNSKPSIQRVQTTIIIIAGIVYAFMYEDAINASIMISLGLTGKLVQKIFEKK